MKLHEAVTLASKAVGSRPTIPILSCLKIGDGRATGTDMNLWIEAKCDALEIDPVAVDATRLVSALNAVGDDAALSVKGDGLAIKGSRGRARLTIIGAQDFPLMSEIDDPAECVVDGDGFRSICAVSQNFVEANGPREYLDGAHMRLRDGSLLIDVTDGRIVVRDNLQASGGEFDCIVPTRALKAIAGMAGGEIQFAVGERYAAVSGDEVRIVTRLVNNRYPDLDSQLPPREQRSCAADCASLRDAASRVGWVDGEVWMDFSDGAIRLSNSNNEADAAAEIEASCDFEARVKVNYRQLIAVLSASGETAAIHIGDDPIAPIWAIGSNGRKCAISPLRG